VKAPPRRRAGTPGGGKSQEGIGLGRWLTTIARTTDPHPEQSPEAGHWDVALASNRQQRPGANDERARVTDEVIRLGVGSKPLEGEPWTWLWGETNPPGRWRMKPSRA
jgi:hypothetical protein